MVYRASLGFIITLFFVFGCGEGEDVVPSRGDVTFSLVNDQPAVSLTASPTDSPAPEAASSSPSSEENPSEDGAAASDEDVVPEDKPLLIEPIELKVDQGIPSFEPKISNPPPITIADQSAPWLLAYELSGKVVGFGYIRSEDDWTRESNVIVEFSGKYVWCDSYLTARLYGSKTYEDSNSLEVRLCATTAQSGVSPNGVKFTVYWKYLEIEFFGFSFSDPCLGKAKITGKTWTPKKSIIVHYEYPNGKKTRTETSFLDADATYAIDGNDHAVSFDNLTIDADGVMSLGIGDYFIDGLVTLDDVNTLFDGDEAPDDVSACWHGL